jgi:hypothetical protein
VSTEFRFHCSRISIYWFTSFLWGFERSVSPEPDGYFILELTIPQRWNCSCLRNCSSGNAVSSCWCSIPPADSVAVPIGFRHGEIWSQCCENLDGSFSVLSCDSAGISLTWQPCLQPFSCVERSVRQECMLNWTPVTFTLVLLISLLVIYIINNAIGKGSCLRHCLKHQRIITDLLVPSVNWDRVSVNILKWWFRWGVLFWTNRRRFYFLIDTISETSGKPFANRWRSSIHPNKFVIVPINRDTWNAAYKAKSLCFLF